MSSSTAQAEEYELQQAPAPSTSSRPSSPVVRKSNHKKRNSHSKRTFTLHNNSSVLFSAPSPNGDAYDRSDLPGVSPSIPQTPFRRRTNRGLSDPTTPRLHLPSSLAHQDLFLHEDPSHAHGGTETVELPDFSGMLGLNAEGEDNYLKAQGMSSSWKRRLFLLMEEPGSSREAFALHVFSTSGILFSALLTILSTLPSFHTNPTSTKILFGMDVSIVVLFTVEYLARFLAHTDSWRMLWNWVTTFFAIVDLLAILPFYIEVALQEDTTILFRFSILRTLRLLRVFRAFKYQNQMLFTIEVMYIAVHRSKDALFALSFFLVMALVVFSTLIYFVERGVWDSTLGTFVTADGDPSQFESIPSAAWFVLVTITTVGYGEIIPRSVLGRLFTVPLLVFGLLLIALPSFVLGRNFAIVFDAMQHQLAQPANAALAGSVRTSMERDNLYSGSLPGPSAQTRSGLDSPDSPDSVTFRLADRGTVTGGNQYDAIPTGDVPLRTGVADVSMSGGDSFRPASAQGQKKGQPQTSGVAGASAIKDLTNAKLALNQSVLLNHIERLTEVTERQGEMLDRIMALLDQKLRPEPSRESST